MSGELSRSFNTSQPKKMSEDLFVSSESLSEVESRSRGGLAQVSFSPVGGSPTGGFASGAVGFALTCFEAAVLAGDSPLTIWISDQGAVYPPLIQEKWKISLPRFLMVSTKSALESWKTALEAVQSGLFRWVFLEPSQTCPTIDLRKLQLAAERTQTKVVLLSKLKLPHWYFKLSLKA